MGFGSKVMRKYKKFKDLVFEQVQNGYMAELFLGKLLQSAKSEGQRNFVNLFLDWFTRNSTL